MELILFKKKLNKVVVYTNFIFLLFTTTALAENKKLKDIDYYFDQTKVETSSSPLSLLRSFIDLFYLIIINNAQQFPALEKLEEVKAWCAGDVHPENFGIQLLENQEPIYTINDMDDSGPCPVVFDLFRLIVSSKLYNDQINIEKIINAYTSGLKAKNYLEPKSIQKMMNQAIKMGFIPSPKKVKDKKFIRNDQMRVVTVNEKNQIVQLLNHNFKDSLSSDYVLLDLVARAKDKGGSKGLLRYEILLENHGQLLHLEFKEQSKPNLYPIMDSIPTTAEKIKNSLFFNQGASASKLYKVVQVNSKNMLVRPRFAGNIGVELKEKSPDRNEDIIYYEAYVLGKIHSRSVQSLEKWIQLIKDSYHKTWNDEAELMTDYFNKKFKELKN